MEERHKDESEDHYQEFVQDVCVGERCVCVSGMCVFVREAKEEGTCMLVRFQVKGQAFFFFLFLFLDFSLGDFLGFNFSFLSYASYLLWGRFQGFGLDSSRSLAPLPRKVPVDGS